MITCAGVAEVAELRLPEDQALRRGGRVAVLEAEAGVLRERAVVDLERRQRAGEVLDRRVLEPGLLVVEDEVAVREGAALGVLAGEPDVGALGQQRGEASASAWPNSIGPSSRISRRFSERLAQLAVDREALGHLEQLLVQRPDPLLGDRRLDLGALGAVELAGSERGRGRVLELAGLDLRPQLLELALERGELVLAFGLDVLGGDRALLDQALGVDLGDRRVLLDLGRLQRLRVGGLVGLVVAVAAVADQVDDDVAPQRSR